MTDGRRISSHLSAICHFSFAKLASVASNGPRIMRPYLMLSAMFIWLASAMTASAGEPTLTLDVWPDEAPGETGSIGPEKVIDQKPGDKPVKLLTNVTHPTLSVFRPACDKGTQPGAEQGRRVGNRSEAGRHSRPAAT